MTERRPCRIDKKGYWVRMGFAYQHNDSTPPAPFPNTSTSLPSPSLGMLFTYTCKQEILATPRFMYVLISTTVSVPYMAQQIGVLLITWFFTFLASKSRWAPRLDSDSQHTDRHRSTYFKRLQQNRLNAVVFTSDTSYDGSAHDQFLLYPALLETTFA